MRKKEHPEAFLSGSEAGLKFIGLIIGSHEFDSEDDVLAARQASLHVPEGTAEAKAAGLYVSMFIRERYIEKYSREAESGTD